MEEEALDKALDGVTAEANVFPIIDEPTELEVTYRESDIEKTYFIINFVEDEQPLPKYFVGQRDLLSDKELDEDTILKQYDVIMVSIAK